VEELHGHPNFGISVAQWNIGSWTNMGEKNFENIGIGFKK